MPDTLARSNAHRVGKGKRTSSLNPGLGTDEAAWTHLLSEFATRYRLVLFDHVGGGGADILAFSPHHHHSLRKHSANLLEIIVAQRLSHAIDGATSISAMIEILAAVDASDADRFWDDSVYRHVNMGILR